MSFAKFLRILIWFVAISSIYGYVEHPGSRFPPTKGDVWPKPQSQQRLDGTTMVVVPEAFQFMVTGKTCKILDEALARYTDIIFVMMSKRPPSRRSYEPRQGPNLIERQRQVETSLDSLEVNLTSDCEEWPSLSMDESYQLEISTEKPSTLKSNSIWGILRGLETFSQLVHIDNTSTKDLSINPTRINDFPRFSHRGILLDTSRHYVSVSNILKLLDGMVYNKLNVFHWHIVDDQSFPYESVRYPSLSGLGAYHSSLVYSQADVQKIIEYARIRGIRVMPEFDTPGHTRSWGVSYPELLTSCYGNDGKPNGDLGPMNPVNAFLYTFMNNLLKEVVTVFPDKYVHLGGDEVDFDCWESNPQVQEYMTNNNISTYHQLEEIYIQKIVDTVNDLKANSVVWQEVFVNGVKLPLGTVVHIWTGDRKYLTWNVTHSGLPALLSSCWYLDHLDSGGDWTKYYECDPHDFPGDEAQKKLVLGGEACMWGEVVDDSNVLSRIFPRASATAEKLWSAEDVIDWRPARNRLEEHYCRMRKRGFPAQPPNGPGFCV